HARECAGQTRLIGGLGLLIHTQQIEDLEGAIGERRAYPSVPDFQRQNPLPHYCVKLPPILVFVPVGEDKGRPTRLHWDTLEGRVDTFSRASEIPFADNRKIIAAHA